MMKNDVMSECHFKIFQQKYKNLNNCLNSFLTSKFELDFPHFEKTHFDVFM